MISHDDNEPLLTSGDLLAYRRASGQLPDFPPPRTVIFAPQKSLADYVLRRHSTRRIKGFLGELYLLKRTDGQVALSTRFGIGAPVIAALADAFTALGVKQFGLVGVAGGLQSELTAGSLVICRNALRGEGVSQHYLPPHPTVDSSVELVHKLSQVLVKDHQSYKLGTVWTTDAPFRELRRIVMEHQRSGLLAVEMEAAGLLSVARSMGSSAIAAFSIADQLADGQWRMARDQKPVQRGLEILFEALFEALQP